MTTKQELLRRVEELGPLIREKAVAAESARKPDDDVIKALEVSEVFKALVPRRFGGVELGVDAMAELTAVIARYCVSTAQVATFYIGHNLMMARMSHKAQEIAFGSKGYTMAPTAFGPTIRPKKVEGGYLVDGRGHWGTGIMHADWLLVTGVMEDGVTRLQMLVPMSDVEIDDVWHMSGMAATGSNDFILKDVFVPDHMTEDTLLFAEGISEGAKIHENPMYHLPLMQVIYAEIIGMFVGALQGMNIGYQAIVQKHSATLTGVKVADKVATHMQLGDGHAKAMAAQDMMDGLIGEIISLQGGEWGLQDRLSNKVRAAYLVRFCVESVNQIALKSGAGSFHVNSPTQRIFRDINTIGTHGFWDWDISREQWGRDFVGLDPNHELI